MAPSDFNFEAALSRLREAIDVDFAKDGKPGEYVSAFQTISGTDGDRKSASDHCLKLALQRNLQNETPNTEQMVQVLQFGTSCARKGLCSILTPFTLISDSLDCSTLQNCEG